MVWAKGGLGKWVWGETEFSGLQAFLEALHSCPGVCVILPFPHPPQLLVPGGQRAARWLQGRTQAQSPRLASTHPSAVHPSLAPGPHFLPAK